MERSEPSLAPQWLKNTGTQNGSGSVSSHSDDHTSMLKVARNKSFVDSKGNDFERSLSFDKTTSSYFRRNSSSNGSGHLRSRSSFGKNQPNRDWERGTYDSHNKDKSFLGDRNRRHRDLSDSLGNSLFSKFERDGLRRSHSLVSGKHEDASCNKVVTDLSNSGNNTNGFLSKGSPDGGVKKISFETDFPSLGAEEKPILSEVGRVPSPGLSSAIQSLPIGTSTNIAGEKWTSALAEVPALVVQHEAPSSASLPLGTSSSLNMAEAVAQGPSRAQTAPQLSVGTQRLEELAIKQSRQLIPVTPSSPKTLVLSSSDKQKTRVGQQPLHPVSSPLAANHSPRGGAVKSDASRSLIMGKLQVLKPVREKNVTAPVAKDNSSQASGSKLINSTLAAPAVSGPGPAATRAPLTNPVHERKPMLEKRPTFQAQSRNDFFNSVRKKSMGDSTSVLDSTTGNSSSVVLNSSNTLSLQSSNKHSGTAFVHTANPSQNSSANHLPEMNGDSQCNGNVCIDPKNTGNQNKLSCSDPILPEEEEAAFLRSLGWEENAEEGGLTEEEINAFFQDITKYISSKPSLKILQGVQPKFLSPVLD